MATGHGNLFINRNQKIVISSLILSLGIKIFDCVAPNETTYIDCNSPNVIYLITCNRCTLQYVGETVLEKLNKKTGFNWI